MVSGHIAQLEHKIGLLNRLRDDLQATRQALAVCDECTEIPGEAVVCESCTRLPGLAALPQGFATAGAAPRPAAPCPARARCTWSTADGCRGDRVYRPRGPSHPEDRPAIERAVSGAARRLRPAARPQDLVGTPARVARVWSEEFLSGFAMDPAQILGDPVEGEGASELVLVRGLPFHGLCPHHLLPYTGTASSRLPARGRLAGFGRLGDLVTCFTRR
jgi:hypothetical protein